MIKNKVIDELIEALRVLPNIGTKNARKYAYHLLTLTKKQPIKNLIEKLESVANIKNCTTCFDFVDSNSVQCYDCAEVTPFKKILLIEDYFLQDMFLKFTDSITKLYVLPLLTLEAEQKINTINVLGDYIAKHGIEEVIVSFAPTFEGETNARLIKGYLNDPKISFTKINVGVPIGSSLDYADPITLEASIKKREKF